MRPFNSMKKRLILMLLCSVCTITALLYFACQHQILPQIKRLEQQAAMQQIELLRANLDTELKALDTLVHDFIFYNSGQIDHTTPANLWQQLFPVQLLPLHGLSDMAIYSAQGTLLAGRGFNLLRQETQPVNNSLCRSVLAIALANPKRSITGLMSAGETIMMVTAHAINPSTQNSTNPIIIFCRPLTTNVVHQSSSLFQLDVAIKRLPLSADDRYSQKALQQLSDHQQVVLQQMPNQRVITHARLVDLNQRPLGLIQLSLARQPFLEIEHKVATTLGLLLTSLLLIILLTTERLRRIILQPFKGLTQQVHQLRQQQTDSELPLTQGSEQLTKEINALLDDLAQSRLNQNVSEIKTDLIKRIVPCAIFTVDQSRTITCWNERAEQLTGYTAKEMVGSSYFRFIQNPSHETTGKLKSHSHRPVVGREFNIRHKNGTMLTISKNSELLRNGDGEIIGGIECFIDITHHKREKDALQWEVALNSRLSNLSQTMVEHIDDTTEIAKKVLSQARNLTDSLHGFVAEFDDSGKQRLWDYTSLFDEFDSIESPAHIPAAPSGRGSLLHAVYNRKTSVYFNELEQLNVAHLAGGIEKPFCHFMAVPINNGNKIIGQITVANNKNGYSIRDLHAIEQLAELFAIVLVKHQKENPQACATTNTQSDQLTVVNTNN